MPAACESVTNEQRTTTARSVRICLPPDREVAITTVLRVRPGMATPRQTVATIDCRWIFGITVYGPLGVQQRPTPAAAPSTLTRPLVSTEGTAILSMVDVAASVLLLG